ncbi:MAG: nickel pincer cofactor biosynthesis protein LarC [Mangrovibacterium sp.]
MKILYYDCFAGISGDMNLGALVDLGVDAEYLTAELEKLNIEGFRLEVKTDTRRGISGTKVDVIVENPDNEKHRHLRHVEELVNNSTLSAEVKKTALKIFRMIAEAEARVHNIDIQRVHFHEVGALDSIADIVGAAICLDYLKVDQVFSSPIQLGGGTVKCAHGIMPVPAPATALIVQGLPIKTGLVNHEATTPTGAAILAATVDAFTTNIELPIVKTAYGIGNRDSELPNVLRVYLLQDQSPGNDLESVEAVLLESNIDDMNPEHYEFILEQLVGAGASDAWLVPIIMKKSRPAVVLSVLCQPALVDVLKSILFTHSTSLGIRESRLMKYMLRRKEIRLETDWGSVRVKQSYFQGRLIHSKPEADDCKELARKHGLRLADIERIVQKKIENESTGNTGTL